MELQELVAANLADTAASDKCPFCGNDPHGFGKNEDAKPSLEVKSIPSSLGCAEISGGGPGRYTTAAHHLICAIQCYKQVRRLVRMGSLVGYDINSSPNGMPLPTVCNKYRNNTVNYSKLGEEVDEDGLSEKDRVAFAMMDATRAQWHVGSHSFEIKIEDYDTTEGGDSQEYLHTTSYDNEVIRLLLEIVTDFGRDELCAKDKDNRDTFINTMNDISDSIKTKLKEFEQSNPIASSPLFVSDRSVRYAKAIKQGRYRRRVI